MPEIPAGAIDLAEVKARADARDAALREVAEKKALEEAQAISVVWDRAMRRAFKGIVPRPAARATLLRSMSKHSDE